MKGKHELSELLPDRVDPDQALLFAAGILWEQALGGRPKATANESEASQTMESTWKPQSGPRR